MARTMYALGLWTSRESWRTVRSFRAHPSEAVAQVLKTRDRADVFHTALEQAEQLFAAAADVRYESRPLLLFYGLSQAGRALAAASHALEGRAWAATGHGLVAAVDSVKSADIWRLRTRVEPKKTDLFSRASAALSSPTDIVEVRLGEVAASLIDFIYEFDDFDAFPRVLTLEPLYPPLVSGAGPESEFFEYPIQMPTDTDPDRFIAQYPILRPYRVQRAAEGAPRRNHNGHILLAVPTTRFELDGGDFKLKARMDYRGTDVAPPALGQACESVHPLMAWWIALHALSMLARYQPRTWSQLLDIRRSEDTSRIEHLADSALDAVPHLLANALSTLDSSPT